MHKTANLPYAKATAFRPAMPRDHAVLYDVWLIPNGIAEYLPEDATVEVNAAAGTITYSSFVWNDTEPRGFNNRIAATCDALSERVLAIATANGQRVPPKAGEVEIIAEYRTVPLRVPLSDEVRWMFERSTLRLVEAS